MSGRRIAIVAGEASGDMLGAALIKAVREREPDARFYGIAGPRMMAEGAESLFPMEKLAVSGYVEVIRHLPELLGIRKQLAKRFLEDRPDVFIGVDAPDFNLALETKLRSKGVRTVHYVSPSIWAWRAERIHKIKRAVDHMLAVFPFEEAIYEKAGIPVTYVGHPLADEMPLAPDRDGARSQLRLARTGPAVAMLPGSRMKELVAHADLMIGTARILHKERPELRFFIPLATRETRDYFETRLYALDANELPITILFGHARLALNAADVALVASGTATLEAALARCPMVITYRVPKLTYWLMMRKALLPYVGLPNILAGEFIVPELLQEDATPQNLAQALGNWLDNKDARAMLRERFAAMHESLAQGHAERVASALLPFLHANARKETISLLCGVDEAGRGPLAGSVFAAAVILDPDRPVEGLNDSKLLGEEVREELAIVIKERARCWAIASASVEEIERMNILRASLFAMRRAILALSCRPLEVCVDGIHKPPVRIKCTPVVKADRTVPEVSAASILAKTARDAEMREMDTRFPGYGFASHKGYSTPEHLTALKALGPCAIHRRSFEPVRVLLQVDLPF